MPSPTPNPVGAKTSVLSGVPCTSKSACTAVGYYTYGKTYLTPAERRTAAFWDSYSGAKADPLSSIRQWAHQRRAARGPS